MSIIFKHVLRKLKESPFKPILIVCALCIATASVLLACKVSSHLYHDAESMTADHTAYDLTLKPSLDSAVRLLFTDEAEEIVGEDGRVLGEFRITGLCRFEGGKEIVTLSASNFEKTDAFYRFKFTDYGVFTEDNRQSTVILGKDAADRYGLSLGDTLHFSIFGRTYSFEVAAIALPTGVLGECMGVIDISAITEELARHSSAIASLSGNFAPATLLHVALDDPARIGEFEEKFASSPAFADADLVKSADEQDRAAFTNQITLIVTLTVCFIVLVLSGILAVGALDILQRERRQDTALLMLAGADRAHLNLFTYAESLLYGVFGMVGGALLSLPLYRLLENRTHNTLSLSFAPHDLLIAALAAPLLIFLFTFLRIRRTGNHSVSELLLESQNERKSKKNRKALLLLALLFAALLTLTVFTPAHRRHITSIVLIGAGIALLFAFAPFFIDFLSTLLHKFLAKRKHVPPCLYTAVGNLHASYPLQHVFRILTLSLAMLIPITLCVNAIEDEHTKVESIVDCDYVALGADAKTEALLQEDPAIAACYRFAFDDHLSTVYGTNLRTVSADADALPYLNPAYAPKRLPNAGETVLSGGVAALYGAEVGDRVDFVFDTHTYTFTVIEIIDVFTHVVYVDAPSLGIPHPMLCIKTQDAESEDQDSLFADISNRLELRGALLCHREDALAFALKRMSVFHALISITTLTAALATVVGILNLLFAQYRARANDLRACRCAGMTRADIRRLLFTEILLLFLAALLLAIPAAIGFCRILDVTVNAFGADFFF